MPVRVKTGENRGHTGPGEGGIGIGVIENNTVPGQLIDMGRGVTAIPVYPQVGSMATVD